MADAIELTVNDQSHRLSVSGDAPLLYVLRNDLELNGAKFGCGLAQCGARTVLAQGPTAAAITNAVVPATGVRLRDLPLLPEWVKAAFG